MRQICVERDERVRTVGRRNPELQEVLVRFAHSVSMFLHGGPSFLGVIEVSFLLSLPEACFEGLVCKRFSCR